MEKEQVRYRYMNREKKQKREKKSKKKRRHRAADRMTEIKKEKTERHGEG